MKSVSGIMDKDIDDFYIQIKYKCCEVENE